MANSNLDSKFDAIIAEAADKDKAKAQAQFELGVSLALFFWPALKIAVQNEWGGPDSADKRDWMAGAVATLFEERPDTDADDVADMLLQIMEEEFEVVVEDSSEDPVAELIVKIWTETRKSAFGTVERLWERWKEKGGERAPDVKVVSHEDEVDSVDEEDWNEDVDEDGDQMMVDATMEEAATQPKKDKPPPEIDEDGFTKVVGKKRR